MSDKDFDLGIRDLGNLTGKGEVKQSSPFDKLCLNVKKETNRLMEETRKLLEANCDHKVYSSQIVDYALNVICRDIRSNPESYHAKAIMALKSPKGQSRKG